MREIKALTLVVLLLFIPIQTLGQRSFPQEQPDGYHVDIIGGGYPSWFRGNSSN